MQKNKTMKKIIILILISTISCTKGQDKSENHLSSLNLSGEIKSIVEKTYKATVKFGEPVKTDNIEKNELIFNDFGYLSSKKTQFFSIINSTIFYEYDNLNNILVETEKNEDGSQYRKHINKYDDNNKLIEVEYYANGENWFSKSKYEYDNNKRILNSYDKDGNFESRWIDILDQKNNVIKSFNYDKNGELEFEWKFNFDDRGNKTQNVLVYILKSLNPNTTKLLYDDEIKEYNKKNEVSKIYEDAQILKFTFKYKYDEKNNWINKIKYNKEGSAVEITERNITYK